jgi:hypothetical protein
MKFIGLGAILTSAASTLGVGVSGASAPLHDDAIAD